MPDELPDLRWLGPPSVAFESGPRLQCLVDQLQGPAARGASVAGFSAAPFRVTAAIAPGRRFVTLPSSTPEAVAAGAWLG